MTLRIRFKKTGAIDTLENVEYLRKIEKKRKIRTYHFYEIKQLDSAYPVKIGASEFEILEVLNEKRN